MAVLARMWEARVDPGRVEEALGWVRGVVVPAAQQAGCDRAALFRTVDRVVLITWWEPDEGWQEPDPPAGLLARPPHAWTFDEVPL